MKMTIYALIKPCTLVMLIVFVLSAFLVSCNKAEGLEQKPNTSLGIPTTLTDFQAILDANDMTTTPGLGDASADNYYATDTYLQSASKQQLNVYIWAKDVYEGLSISDWNISYSQIMRTNIVIEGLNNIDISRRVQPAWSNIMGQALFFRAFAFYNLAQVFVSPYDSSSSKSSLGLPLRLKSDIDLPSIRSTVQETYDQIIADLKEARHFVSPVFPQNNRNRPSLQSVFGLLSKVYMSAGAYSKAGLYADSCLQLYSKLNDYNSVAKGTGTALYFPYNYTNNDEVIFSSIQNLGGVNVLLNSVIGRPGTVGVDTLLYRLYNVNDLRRSIFYYSVAGSGTYNLNGGYSGSGGAFSGVATNEMYLNRAECFARSGNHLAAMDDLNVLLAKRWKIGTFVKYTAVGAPDALSQILAERRKELPFSSVRWIDLRRLNKEGYNIVLKRFVNGQVYTLSPNSSLYTLPIPPDVVALSGIQQNPR